MWRKVHEADLISRLSMAEIDAFRQSDGGSADIIHEQIAAQVAFVRGIIRSAPTRVQLSSDETYLPESVIGPAMDHLRFNMLTRMDLKVNDSRTKAYEQACLLFDQIRKGDFIPESDGITDTSKDHAATPIAAKPFPKRLLD